VIHTRVLYIVYNHHNQSWSLLIADLCSSQLRFYACATSDNNFN